VTKDDLPDSGFVSVLRTVSNFKVLILLDGHCELAVLSTFRVQNAISALARVGRQKIDNRSTPHFDWISANLNCFVVSPSFLLEIKPFGVDVILILTSQPAAVLSFFQAFHVMIRIQCSDEKQRLKTANPLGEEI
jgi:hypothetical protein